MSDTHTARQAFPRPSELAPPPTHRRLAWAGPLGWGLVAFGVVATVGAAGLGRVSIFGALLVVVVAAGSRPVLARLSANPHGADLESVLRVGLGMKFLLILPRYELRQDAVDYHAVGRVLADNFRSFDFLVDPGRAIPGTGSVRYLTGLIHLVTFGDEFATFVVFAMFGFVGLALYVRAFVHALPAVDPSRYAVVLMLWPSLAYWPSSTGKEAVVTLGLGMTAYGVSRVLNGRYRALLPTITGLAITGLVRPHVALIALTATVGALVLHSRRDATSGIGVRIALVAALAGVGSALSNGVEQLFEVEDLNVSSVSAALDLANYRSAQGGSSFVAARIDSVADVPWGIITVLLRPFPHEATSGPGLVAAVEGLVLAALLFGAIPRLGAALRHLRQEAYVVYTMAFVTVFVFLFSALGNFGILTRQRTMVTPLLLVLVALPTARERVRARRMGSAR
ncbi:MAG: hypothetical protein AAGE98_02165 [Actinomycetota bacterium]